LLVLGRLGEGTMRVGEARRLSAKKRIRLRGHTWLNTVEQK
jgi:hypothetical protein